MNWKKGPTTIADIRHKTMGKIMIEVVIFFVVVFSDFFLSSSSSIKHLDLTEIVNGYCFLLYFSSSFFFVGRLIWCRWYFSRCIWLKVSPIRATRQTYLAFACIINAHYPRATYTDAFLCCVFFHFSSPRSCFTARARALAYNHRKER